MQSLILESIRRWHGDDFSVCVTERPGDAQLSAEGATANGCQLILAVGGDGTINEIINGLLADDNGPNTHIDLGVISCGTGHGLAQSLGLPSSIDHQARIAASNQTRHIDAARVVFRTPNGESAQRYFINECQIGIGAAVVERVESHQKRFGGLVTYGFGTLMLLKNHPNQVIQVTVDNDEGNTGTFVGICIGNGSRTAGGIRLTPQARLDDGLMDVLFLHGQPFSRRLLLFPWIPSGRHIHSDHCSYFQARRISFSSGEYVSVAADGEALGSLPCTIEIIPGALRVRCLPDRKE
jgi:YegS/Rv2252/BmrU family lipid kinase